MKAAIRRKYGSPDTVKVENIEQPIPADNEVLVKVYATTVNRTDCANLTAKPFLMRFFLGFFKPRQIVLGTDFAGEIISTGKKVKSFKTTDRVFGFVDSGLGTQAEFLTVTEDKLFGIPAGFDYKEAVASIEGAHYAYSFIQKAKLKAGQKIFINGATGAIGSALLQLLGQYDVEVVVSCNTKNIALIRSLGAQKIYDYTKEDFTKDIQQYDFIFDAVGKSTFGKCKPLLKKGGLYIPSDLGPNSQNIFFALITPILGRKKVIIPVPYPINISIPYIIQALKNETFRPVIDREYPLDKISEAYAYVIKGVKTGNVVIVMPT